MSIYIASFDIGKKNFAFVIEKINTELLENIQMIPKNQRFDSNNEATNSYNSLLNKVYKCGEIVLIKNKDLTSNNIDDKCVNPQLFINMTEYLDEYKEYWNKCSAFIIEKQMSFRGKINVMALKLGQHCYSYFSFNYRDFKCIIEFPAYHKTKVLGAPKKITNKWKELWPKAKTFNKYYRKKWAILKAIDILKYRGNHEEILTQKKVKKDDMADCLLMCITFSYLVFVDKSLKI
jgi:hypothetical protein